MGSLDSRKLETGRLLRGTRLRVYDLSRPLARRYAPTMDPITRDLCIIGGGTMARAIFDGATAAGVLSPQQVIIAEPDQARRADFLSKGAATFSTTADALQELRARELRADDPALILLAIKPQVLPQVAPDLRDFLAKDATPRTLISILAGTPTTKLTAELSHPIRLIRAMPNMPAQIRRGVTALCLGPNTTWDHAAIAETLFRAVGPAVVRIDESLMDAFTALAGSGPAYLFYLAQGMVDAGTELGFDRATSTQIVQQTLAGSAALFAESTKPAAELLAGVQSKGGTTEAAMNVLARERVHHAMVQAITAARDRGRELSQ